MTAVLSAAQTVTPTIRAATRRWLFWILAVVALILIAVAGLAVRGASATGIAFSATNPAPAGSMAVAQVLEQQGVDVRTPQTFAAAKRQSPGSTVFLYDPDSRLDKAQLQAVTAEAAGVVILAPTFGQLRALMPEISSAGSVTAKPLTASCDLGSAQRAASVTGTGFAYRLVDTAANATSCFPSGDRRYSVIDISHSGQTVTAVGTTAALSNEKVDERGNAALALGLLGANPKLVWYLPTIDDSALSGGPSIAELTPLWVGAVSVLLIVVAIVAAFWRGRRLGPLIIENLPVVVRSSETMEGRARLYQKGQARLRALDALRIGAVDRLALACGLPRLATVDEVIAAVAAVTGRGIPDIRSLLIDADPRNDRELVRLSDALLDLERTVARDVRPA